MMQPTYGAHDGFLWQKPIKNLWNSKIIIWHFVFSVSKQYLILLWINKVEHKTTNQLLRFPQNLYLYVLFNKAKLILYLIAFHFAQVHHSLAIFLRLWDPKFSLNSHIFQGWWQMWDLTKRASHPPSPTISFVKKPNVGLLLSQRKEPQDSSLSNLMCIGIGMVGRVWYVGKSWGKFGGVCDCSLGHV